MPDDAITFLKEREDLDGVLVLSEMAGAAQELGDAVMINPYDVEGFAQALAGAIDMPIEERRNRMRAMRRVVAGRNVFGWASDILEGLESLDLRAIPPAPGKLTRGRKGAVRSSSRAPSDSVRRPPNPFSRTG